jgi:hypothetical protein
VRVGPGDELGGREARLACAVVRGAIEVCDGEAGLSERAAQVRLAYAECAHSVRCSRCRDALDEAGAEDDDLEVVLGGGHGRGWP